ncbi:hypothetical protein [Kordiimonas marina]|uniref:hypothetical protein n=1 Tax=Kordiimonas marina TaxID=2872312 RepID=UPI001FF4AEAF|nr:hypothetical protein [Kordiimonas marina]MCJ9430011.1 hypothetical protein [Kordiimonas marina]
MRFALVLLMALFSFTAYSYGTHAADDGDSFLEGFPDVPRLDVIRALGGDPVVFDTPSGTVAEVTLLIRGSGDNALKLYKESLTPLGWKCHLSHAKMRCERENDRIVFTDPAPSKNDGQLVLRLEPKD